MSRRHPLALVTVLTFILVFSVKLAISLTVQSPWTIPDETDYAAAAESTWHHGRLIPEFRGGQPFPPGYSIVLAPAHAAENMRITYHLMLGINCLLTTLAGVVAYLLARHVCHGRSRPAVRPPLPAGERVGVRGRPSAGKSGPDPHPGPLPGREREPSDTAGQDRPWHTDKGEGFALAIGLAAALAPSTWLYSYVLMSENLFVLLFALSCLVALRLGRGGVAWAAVLGVLLGAMFVTRSITVAMVPAAVLACILAARGGGRVLGRLACLIVGVACVVGPWMLYKQGIEARTATGYSESRYLEVLATVLSSPKNLAAYLRILANDLGGIGAMCAGVFLVFALDLVLRRTTWRDARLRTLLGYVVLAVLGTLAVSGLHQFPSLVERGLKEYAVYSRYFDPLVPMLIVLGGVGLWRLRGGRGRLLILSIIVFGLMAFVLPTKPYKTPNTLGLWHLFWLWQAASVRLGPGFGRVGPWILMAAFAVVTVWVLCRRSRRSIVAAVALLTLCGVPTLREMLRASRETASDLRVGLLLDNGVDQGALCVDETIYAESAHDMHRQFVMIRFWSPNRPVFTRRRDAADDTRLLFSADQWPYDVVAGGGDVPWTLYYSSEGLTAFLSDPGFIDLTTYPTDRVTGLYDADERGRRWTGGRASVKLRELPAGEGLTVTLGLGGGRPSADPAHVKVFFDGTLVHEFEKRRSGLYPTFTVPAALVTRPAGHELELRMNTFRPIDYPGWSPDTRDLGLQFLWIKLRPVASAPRTLR